MLVEKWDGRRTTSRASRATTPSRKGRARFTTTLQYLRASRGQFTYEDHETPWSVVCRNLDLNIGNLPKYHGDGDVHGGTVAIQNYVPMWANMKAQFVIDGGRAFASIASTSRPTARRRVAQRRGRHGALARADATSASRASTFRACASSSSRTRRGTLTGDGDFNGTFHLFKRRARI